MPVKSLMARVILWLVILGGQLIAGGQEPHRRPWLKSEDVSPSIAPTSDHGQCAERISRREVLWQKANSADV
ncbi:MAG: hypothetical protein JXL20_11940 [Deltaproteobacteria bacterium]|nr:hypothetical protein [Deltaproteobacteria bacterium]